MARDKLLNVFRTKREKDTLILSWDGLKRINVLFLLDEKTRIPTTNSRLMIGARSRRLLLDPEVRDWKSSWSSFMNIAHRQILIDWVSSELETMTPKEREAFLVKKFGEKRGRLFESKIQRDIIQRIDSLFKVNETKEMIPLILLSGYYGIIGRVKDGMFLSRDLDNFEKTIVDTLFSGNVVQLVSPFSANDKQIMKRSEEKGLISLSQLQAGIRKMFKESKFCYSFSYPWIQPTRTPPEISETLDRAIFCAVESGESDSVYSESHNIKIFDINGETKLS